MTTPLRKVLLFSTLYPSRARPEHGIFVETRLRELLKLGGVDARVVAPVPWFPSTAPRWGEWARMAAAPQREARYGIDVLHPRYALPPRVGMTVAPLLLALGARGAVQRIRDEGFDFDLIDAHYYYPDGVAAALLAMWFDRPFAITARGSDLNLLPRYRLPRVMMQWAARRAAASIGVCAALVDVLRTWGVEQHRLHVLRNGVDLERFRPLDRDLMRRELLLPGGPILLSVGHLVERKGHHVAIAALAELRTEFPEAMLIVVGEGVERTALLSLAERLGVAHAVRLAGRIPNEELSRWYSAADVLLLASSREGWANVLLESMACGTPVVATDIWGTPEVVASPDAGCLVGERQGPAFARAVRDLLQSPPSRTATRRYAERFSWSATSEGQRRLFDEIVRQHSIERSSCATP